MTTTTASATTANGSNFHSSGLRQKVDQLMDILWAGGVNNPMDSIEQISYLLFLRLLSEKDELLAALDKKYKRVFSSDWAKYAWGNFVTLTGDPLFDAIRAAIESLHELPGLSSTGKLLFQRATLKIYDRPTLRAVVQAIHGMDLESHDGVDLKGDMYEYLLSRLSMSGTNGQFRTPRHIIAIRAPFRFSRVPRLFPTGRLRKAECKNYEYSPFGCWSIRQDALPDASSFAPA